MKKLGTLGILLGQFCFLLGQPLQQTYYVLGENAQQVQAVCAKYACSYQTVSPILPMFKIEANSLTINELKKSSRLKIFPAEQNPKEETSVPGHDLAVNQLNQLHADFPQWNGEGKTVSLKENAFDASDVDLLGRVQASENAAKEISLHATLMASTLVGAGNSDTQAKGGAWAANIASSDFSNLLPDEDSLFLIGNISVQNHSYGTQIAANYGAEAYLYDAQAYRLPTLLHVFSSGNEGMNQASEGTYANLKGYANLTGNFKMAKNVLTVGATDAIYQVQPYSSKGPAVYGRIKPELVAYSSNGTSGAAATVSAATLLLQQAYQTTYNQTAPASLLKAILLTTTDEVGEKGIDYASGFGSLNAWAAMNCINYHNFLIDTIKNTSTKTYPFHISQNVAEVKISLAWTDKEEGNGKLSQDINMRLYDANGNQHLPWCLNAHRDSILQPAFRGIDSMNTEEQISLEFPTEGDYFLEIEAVHGQNLPQVFALAWQSKLNNSLQWTFPAKEEAAYAKEKVYLRWNSTNTTQQAILSYQWLGDSTWNIIDTLSPSARQHLWELPDSVGILRFRWQNANATHLSPTLKIHSPLRLDIGFDCTDSVGIYWNKVENIIDYQLFSLGNRYLEPQIITKDSFWVVQKNTNPAVRWAVAPIFADGKLGKRSPAPNYQMQGTACYFQSILATLFDAGQVELFASIGASYQVESVQFEKWDGTHFQLFGTPFPPQNLNFTAIDEQPRQGENRYRASLTLSNGTQIFTEEQKIYATGKAEFLLFPNPTSEKCTVLCRDYPSNGLTFELLDALGKVIIREGVTDISHEINLANLASGLYFYSFYNKQGRITGGILERW
ncbi:MAG: S8 family serine peptidase [Bacteroidia bacterium]